MRAPAVAGAFYEARPDALRRQVEACFTHPLGPGALPGSGATRPRALVVPHAGLAYSGPVAAHAYKALAEGGLPEAVIVVGPDHSGGAGLGALSSEDWDSPLGPMPQHAALRKALEGSVLLVDDAAHAGEHSVEVQVPFLRWLAARAGRDLPFLPVLMGLQDEATAREVGQALAAAVRAAGADVVLVASSDLMHAGPTYRIPVPKGMDAGAFVRAQDAHALAAIEALAPERLLDVVRAKEVSMCGAGPVAAVLHAAKALGATRAEVLAHATSHDIQAHHSAVGYAAIAFR